MPFTIDQSTELVVDSFPRSANSYAEAAMILSMTKSISIAHHSHAAAQVLFGVKKKLPAVILIRNPIDAIASFIDLHDGAYPVNLAAKEYHSFYSTLLPQLDKLVIVRTELIRETWPTLLRLLNKRYGLSLQLDLLDNEVHQMVLDRMDQTGASRNDGQIELYSTEKDEVFRQNRQQRLAAIKSDIERTAEPSLIRDIYKVYDTFFLSSI